MMISKGEFEYSGLHVAVEYCLYTVSHFYVLAHSLGAETEPEASSFEWRVDTQFGCRD